jgi:Aminotransferase class-V
MPKLARLYLDTARLGLMSPSAQLAARDFARLAGEGVSTLYFQNLLRSGCCQVGAGSPVLLPGIAGWPGMGRLRQLFREFVRLPKSAPVLFAGRSTSLMKFAARRLWSRCQRLLVPDTVWPPYLRILEEERLRRGGILIPIPIRDVVLRGQIDSGSLISRMARAFDHHRCDGLFLAAISHDGVRIPAAPLLAAIRRQRKLRLAVIDGAQELAHAPVNLAPARCDIYLAGCHKWLGAHQPLGVAMLANPDSASALHDALVADCQTTLSDDPLLRFLLHLEGQEVADAPETVNLAPLFTAWGAMLDVESSPESQAHRFAIRQQNASSLAATASKRGWTPRLPHPSLRTGILLLQSTDEADGRLTAGELELNMAERGVTLTSLGSGLLRLALPDRLLSTDELEQIVDPRNEVFANPIAQQPFYLTPISHPE